MTIGLACAPASEAGSLPTRVEGEGDLSDGWCRDQVLRNLGRFAADHVQSAFGKTRIVECLGDAEEAARRSSAGLITTVHRAASAVDTLRAAQRRRHDVDRTGLPSTRGQRLSRILTTLLLLQAGYAYVPYSSVESVVEQNKERYHLAA